MRRLRCALATLACAVTAWSQSQRPAPTYTADSIVNLASGERGYLAPNTLAAICGKNLAPYGRVRRDSDLQGNYLPFQLPGSGVTVKVSGLLAPVESISPEVVTFLVPSELRPGPVTVVLTYNGLNGPTLRLQLAAAAPAWFQHDTGWALARHRESMEWVDETNPTRAGEPVILYLGGLGDTQPVLPYREFPRDPVPLAVLPRLSFDGIVVEESRILYVGLTPNFPGVYEVDVVLPQTLARDPALRLEVPGGSTAAGTRLRFEPTPQPVTAPVRSTR